MSSSQSPVKPRLAPSERLRNVPPYTLAKVFQNRDEKLRQGVDVIDLGVGNPDIRPPRIALEAIDSDVLKTYVRLGLGVGIVAETAMLEDDAKDLVTRPAGTLFGLNVTRLAFKRGAYLRNFVYHFAELVSPKLGRDVIAKAMTGRQGNSSL